MGVWAILTALVAREHRRWQDGLASH
jgi:hypothetical protein